MDVDDYRAPGPITAINPREKYLVAALESTPPSLCRAAQGLVISPNLAAAAEVPSSRLDEQNVRPAARLLGIALALCDAPLDQPRSATERVVGTCRHFAVLSCAFLRAQGVAARARCGFATYFTPGLHVDHWITEYWSDDRWVRIDSEILDSAIVERPDDLPVGAFLSGGEAWRDYRSGARDGSTFGVDGGGPDCWGPSEIVGNLIRDLAALNRTEMLPWDVWGPMQECYDGGIDADTALLMDTVAQACVGETREVVALYDDELRVPQEMIG